MKINKILALVFVFNSSICFAASQYTHAVVAKMWFQSVEKSYSDKEKQWFMLGALFPDIRYLANLPKALTHGQRWFISLDDVYNAPTPFQAGMKLHAWVDPYLSPYCWRILLLLGYVLFAEIKMGYWFGKYTDTIFKLSLDQVIYDTKGVAFIKEDREMVLGCLGAVDQGELVFTSEQIVRQWHAILRCFFTSRVDVMLAAGEGVCGPSPSSLKTWAPVVSILAEDQKIKAYATWFLHTIEDEFDVFAKKIKGTNEGYCF